MNKIEKTIIARKIYEKQCKRCRLRVGPCGESYPTISIVVPDSGYSGVCTKEFNKEEIENERCYEFYE